MPRLISFEDSPVVRRDKPRGSVAKRSGPSTAAIKRLALDCEATGLDLRFTARPFLVTFCNEAGENTWYEWDVDPFTRMPVVPNADLDEIQELIKQADEIVGQNIRFDFTALTYLYRDHKRQLRWDWSKVKDTLIAGHLIASNQLHDLTSMVRVLLGENILPLENAVDEACLEARRIAKREYPGWRIADKKLPEMPSAKEKVGKFDMWLPRAIAKAAGYPPQHPWWIVTAKYANGDSAMTLPLYLRQKQLIEQRGLWRIYLERLKLLPIIYKMEERGLTYSKVRLEESRKEFSEVAKKSHAVCVNLADGEIDKLPVNGSSNALKHVIFEKFGLVSSKTTDRGQPSLDKYMLDEWLATLPPTSKSRTFIKNLRQYRQRQTALGYLASYEKFGQPVKGSPTWIILHPSVNPTGTDTLRSTSSRPNEQQISKQSDTNLRYIFGPLPGRTWLALDYENLELRIPAYESGEQVMIELFERPDDPPYFGSYHLMNASIVYPELFWPLAEKKGEFKKRYASTWYQWVKNMGFAISYGAMLGSGTADRAAHRPGAQQLLVNRLKEHSKLNQKMIDLANRQGYVETIPDKTVDPLHGYPIYCSRSQWGKVSPTIPLSYHVQSTACWCKAKAMIRCDKYLSGINEGLPEEDAIFIIVDLHDELVFDFPDRGDANLPIVQELKSLMEKSGEDIGVPLRVAITPHPKNWASEN